jgi:hypothetical protein
MLDFFDMVNLMILCFLEPNRNNFLARIINETLENKVKVLIPVPAVGKSARNNANYQRIYEEKSYERSASVPRRHD